MGWHLNGRASVVFGTHTHVPTADERVFPKGTGYITDVGMTGSYAGVLGVHLVMAIGGFIAITLALTDVLPRLGVAWPAGRTSARR